jgi:hypothetical protein
MGLPRVSQFGGMMMAKSDQQPAQERGCPTPVATDFAPLRPALRLILTVSQNKKWRLDRIEPPLPF